MHVWVAVTPPSLSVLHRQLRLGLSQEMRHGLSVGFLVAGRGYVPASKIRHGKPNGLLGAMA
jgi:hypothetical protein